jgi:dUTP pyrophosphatase
MVLHTAILRDRVKKPKRAHNTDAGIDFFYCPIEKLTLAIRPGETKLLKTGVSVAVPEGFYLEIKNKSGMAYKKQLLVGACVIDAGYDGEVFVNLHNVGNKITFIDPGDKIAQGVLLRHHLTSLKFEEPTKVSERNSMISKRGSGALGSTGVK